MEKPDRNLVAIVGMGIARNQEYSGNCGQGEIGSVGST